MLSSIHLVICDHCHDQCSSAAVACIWEYERFKRSLYSVLRKGIVETQLTDTYTEDLYSDTLQLSF